MSRETVKANRCLDPEKFRVCVSTDCSLLLEQYRADDPCKRCCPPDSDPDESWKCDALKRYVESLGLHVKASACCYCLRGRYAIEHARRVHARIRHEVLQYEGVTAVDVGFAVRQRRKEFRNILAIRIHVAKKQPVSYLRRKGIPWLTDPIWTQYSAANVGAGARRGEQEAPGGDDANELLERWDYPISGVSRSDVSFISEEKLQSFELSGNRDHEAEPLAGNNLQAEVKVEKCNRVCCRGNNDGDLKTNHCCSGCRRHCHCCCERCGRCCRCCCCDSGRQGCCDCQHKKGRLAICGVPLDIIEASYFPSARHPGGDFAAGVFVEPMKRSNHLSDRELKLTGTGKVTPLVGGVSVGSVNGLAGTLGAIVWDETDGSPCALANWHVLAGVGGEVGQPCFQPSLFDGGRHDDVIGHLKRWHLGELGDAAIAELNDSRDFASGENLGMWHPISGYDRPVLNLEVRKWGRTTGFTQGFVDGIHLSTNIDYGSGVIRHFEEQFHIAPLFRGEEVSQSGDSGALVVTSYNLDDLQDIAWAMTRHEIVCCLKEVIGIPDIECLADEVRKILKRWRDCMQQHCGLSIEPPSAANLVSDIVAEMRCHGGGGEGDVGAAALQATKARREAATASDESKILESLNALVLRFLDDEGFDLKVSRSAKNQRQYQEVRNVYRAVGMIFAGDTPGSPFGEFALASDIEVLAKDLRFSLRPVFESRSSFRTLRTPPPSRHRPGHGQGRGRALPALVPGEEEADPRGTGPQPDPQDYQSGSGGTGGG
jgi:hypothetical protein